MGQPAALARAWALEPLVRVSVSHWITRAGRPFHLAASSTGLIFEGSIPLMPEAIHRTGAKMMCPFQISWSNQLSITGSSRAKAPSETTASTVGSLAEASQQDAP